MQSLLTRLMILTVVLLGITAFPSAQQSEQPQIAITGVPSEPVAAGTCTSSTFGYVELNGETAGFTDEEIGKMIMPALRQGYVLTIYPPTKRGIFINQECHSTKQLRF